MSMSKIAASAGLAIMVIGATQIAAQNVGEIGMQQQQTEQAVATQVARAYIRATKKWRESDFEIEFLRREPNGLVVVDAVHGDDLKQKGSNKSVQLHIDLMKLLVVKELGYQ